jgi:hypothetical protein
MANDIFIIKINGKEQDIKMSFGLLNNLCRLVGDIDNAASMAIDPVLRDTVLIELLSDRDARGKITERLDLDLLDADADKIGELIDWAGGHVFDFFLKGLERTKALQDRHLDRIKALIPSQAGSGR